VDCTRLDRFVNGAILMFFEPKNKIALPTTSNSSSLNAYRDVGVTRKELIDVVATTARATDISTRQSSLTKLSNSDEYYLLALVVFFCKTAQIVFPRMSITVMNLVPTLVVVMSAFDCINSKCAGGCRTDLCNPLRVVV